MQRTVITIGVVIVTMLVMFSSKATFAEEEGTGETAAATPAATKVTLAGEVSSKLDDEGNVVKVKFRSEEGKSYSVALTRNGKKLGDMNGKKVEVVGKVIVRSANNRDYEWLRVKQFKEIKEESANQEEQSDSQVDTKADTETEPDTPANP